MAKAKNRYLAIIEKIFFDRYCEGTTEIEFMRTDIEGAVADLGIEPPKNLGDVIYSYRYRAVDSVRIAATQPEGMEWIIASAGQAKYKFQLIKVSRVVPEEGLAVVDIPDATPELIRAYALGDEQALLAIVRYNRLIDTFLGLTTYSLQNHLRTTVKNVGQIEIDEIYIGLDKHGNHHIIPVQAKGGKDKIGSVQAMQDIKFSEERFPGTNCRAVAVQFMDDQVIVFFELARKGDEIEIVQERHYRLVPFAKADEENV